MELSELRGSYGPGLQGYDVPDNMPASAVTQTSVGSLKLESVTVPVPEIGPDEALVAVHAAALNFNTVWTAYGQPVNTFDFLRRLSLTSSTAATHNLDYHIPGSDASGVVVKLGSTDTRWKVGDAVVANCNWHRNDDVDIYNDSMLSNEQKIWGYETNFGSLAAFCVVKIHQLMPKPQHLSWSEAASYSLVLCTAFRMLLSDNGLRIKPNDRVLIWGGAGGLGLSAIQLCKLTGAVPIPVVSSEAKAQFLLKTLEVPGVIDRTAEALDFFVEDEHNPLAWRRLQKIIKKRFGGPPDVVFEHPGREMMAASVYALKKGGKIVSCAATSGYDISYDHRYLWMESKSIIGCHFANPYESARANQLVCQGLVKPFVSSVFNLEEVNRALTQFEVNQGFGKVAVRVLTDSSADALSDRNLFQVAN